MNAAEGRISNTEDELAAFLERNIGGTRDEIVAGAVGNCGQAAHRAGNDEHGVYFVATGGDRGADILVGQNFDFRIGFAEQSRRKLFQVATGDSEFFGEEALTSFSDNQMNFGYEGVFGEQLQCFLCKQSAAGAGHTQSYDLSFGLAHVGARRNPVSQR